MQKCGERMNGTYSEFRNLLPGFPFSRLREKVADRPDEGVGATGSMVKVKRLIRSVDATARDYHCVETPSSALRAPSPASGRRGNPDNAGRGAPGNVGECRTCF